ncbi:hypothetical protein DL96DRAFT_1621524 [Flagelloscypha sp. PMI_526]|nr:hypothetical protein DL96DRAFT_1621524 [Flagelloscypha sp. PMI_526]
MATSLPTEILEHSVAFLEDDPPSLSACSLASPLLIHAEHTEASMCFLFLEMLECSTDLSKYVRKVRILNPQSFTTNDDLDEMDGRNQRTNSLYALLKVLPKLSHVTEVLLWSNPSNYTGIIWAGNSWIEKAIASLPSLRTITAENFMEMRALSSFSFFHKINGLALFYPEANLIDEPATLNSTARPFLTTFRLQAERRELDFKAFLSSSFMQRFDISNVRHLALTKQHSPSPFGSWLTELINRGQTAYLETLVLELQLTADTVLVPSWSLPNLKRIWFTFTSGFDTHSVESKAGWNTWLSSLFACCPPHHPVEVMFFLPNYQQTEFKEFICGLRTELEGRQVTVSYMELGLAKRNSAFNRQELPRGWIYRSHRSEHMIWTAFYDL